MHAYQDANGEQLPINGTGLNGAARYQRMQPNNRSSSWRVAILPYLEQANLYNQFKLDEPWDSEHNKGLIERMPKLYEPVNKTGKSDLKPGYTHMQMVVGPNAMQPGMTLNSIKDGTANTIALVEAAEPVIWTKPDDVMLPEKELPKDWRKKFGGLLPGGFNVALWDGSGRFIPDTMSDRTLELALNPNDGQAMPAEWGPTVPPKKEIKK